MAKLILPGIGYGTADEYRIDKAVKEYDWRLTFGMNEKTGDYCVFIKTEGEDLPEYGLPVVGFGKRIPSVDEAVRMISDSDTRRHGYEIYEALLRHNEAIEKETQDIWMGSVNEAAEQIEFESRKNKWTKNTHWDAKY